MPGVTKEQIQAAREADLFTYLQFHEPGVLKRDAKPGDLIFFQGTYNTSGASHVGIYVGNGMMIHCGDPISYANINTSYWQQHFYTFARLP